MQRRALEDEDIKRLRQLRGLMRRARRGPKRLKDRELADFPRLYRHACTTLARLEARADDPRLLSEVRRIVGEAHGLYYREGSRGLRTLVTDTLRLFLVRSPRAVREEWRLAAFSFAFVYGLALLSWTAVSRDLDLASSLLNPGVVEAQIEQLESLEEGEDFRGNFTFGLGESPQTSAWIMVHNMGVGILFFAAALVPPFYLYLLATNALMLGTYTAVAGHWGQAGSISSILWCHGVIEIQALVLAGTAGLCLVRAWIRPGPRSRRHALHVESRKSWLLLAPVFPMLFAAGLIEGFVSPHAPLGVRVSMAVGTGVLLVGWAVLCGRERAPMRARAAARPR